MDMQKCQTSVSWASMDQVSSRSTHGGHRLGSGVPKLCCKCTQHLLCTWAQISLQEVLDRNRSTWACCCPPPPSAGPAPGYSCLPIPALAVSGVLLCHHLHQSSAPTAGTCPEQPPRLHLQTKRSSCYCKCSHFIKCLLMFVVLVLELLEPENCMRIVTILFIF